MQDPLEDPGLNSDFERELDAALARAPEVAIPQHFRQRLLARIPEAASIPEGAFAPETGGAARPSTWVVPAVALSGASTFAALGWAAIDLGWMEWIAREAARPGVLITILSIESALSIGWLWRMMRAAR